MARYQILYWEHIPLGVKATDVNGTVRENLPARFQQAVEDAASIALLGELGLAAYQGYAGGRPAPLPQS